MSGQRCNTSGVNTPREGTHQPKPPKTPATFNHTRDYDNDDQNEHDCHPDTCENENEDERKPTDHSRHTNERQEERDDHDDKDKQQGQFWTTGAQRKDDSVQHQGQRHRLTAQTSRLQRPLFYNQHDTTTTTSDIFPNS